jgi:hypothetical protein
MAAHRPNEDVMDKRTKSRPLDRPDLKRVLEHIVSTTPATQLFELYYWVQEPGLLKIVRSLASMSQTERDALETFLALAQDLGVATKWDGGDQLVLEIKHLTETFSRLQCSADDDHFEVAEQKLN